jgi:hypothetical protein
MRAVLVLMLLLALVPAACGSGSHPQSGRSDHDVPPVQKCSRESGTTGRCGPSP